MTEFTYGFDDLEIAPGIMANGEADFVKKPNGTFEMMGLTIYWHRDMERLNITSDDHWLWQSIEKALIKSDDSTGILMDACEKEEEKEFDPDEARERRMEYQRIGLL
jgi:hypothetical protein